MVANLMVEQAMRRAVGEPEECVVDLGYLAEADARGEQLHRFGIGLKNFSVEGFGRLLVRIPPSKVSAVLERFPVTGPGDYFGATHTWRE